MNTIDTTKGRLLRLSQEMGDLAKALNAIPFTIKHWKDLARTTYGNKFSGNWYDWFVSDEYKAPNNKLGSRTSFIEAYNKIREFDPLLLGLRGFEKESFSPELYEIEKNLVHYRDIVESNLRCFEDVICPISSNKDLFPKSDPDAHATRHIVKSIRRAAYKASAPHEYAVYLKAKKNQGVSTITHSQQRELEDLETKLLSDLKESIDYMSASDSETGKSAIKYAEKLVATINESHAGVRKHDSPSLTTSYKPWLPQVTKLQNRVMRASDRDERIKRAKIVVTKCVGVVDRLIEIEDSCTTEQTKLPVYKFFTDYLSADDHALIDSWSLELVRVVNGLFSASTKIHKLANTMPDVPAPRASAPQPRPSQSVHNQTNNQYIGMHGNFRSQLEEKKHELFDPKPQPTPDPEPEASPEKPDTLEKNNKWLETQLTALLDQTQNNNRLLDEDEKYGVVEMSVYIVSMHRTSNPDIDAAFAKSRYELKKIMNYTVIDRCLVFGVSMDLVEAAEGNKAEAIGDAYSQLIETDAIKENRKLRKRFSRLIPIKPYLTKGKHVYAMLIPSKAVYPENAKEEISFTVKKWDFQVTNE